ncbi:MAG TPA: amino acid adenylation domain-containing protein [Ktedonobacteraceae bacterium]|nr:amino acid adenylation domain-containing protein [Ktedonobacteraceae bacterium]
MTTEAIENIYGLSPMQRGMLFHTLYAPHSGVYIGQLVCRMENGLDMDLFYQAWQQVIMRHPPLRTAFLWEGMDEPVQVVYRSIEVPWQQHDWRDLSPSQRDVSLEQAVTEDRKQGFDVSQAPLMRLMFYHLSDGSCYFIWTRHHILLDSWSVSAIIQEVSSAYDALRRHCAPVWEPRRPFQEYISWLHRQPAESAETFWRAYLRGFTTPTALPLPDYSADQITDKEQEHYPAGDILAQGRLQGGRPVRLRGFALPVETVAALRAFAGHNQLTLNTLLQGAWALALSQYSGERDVVFGTTVAGRPADLAGSEKMVGLFINTLPVRVQMPAHEELISWLTRLQAQQVEARQYEYSPLVQVQGWSEVSRDRQLFESLVVFENYPLETGDDAAEGQSIRISAAQSLGQTNYPLVLIISATQVASNALKLQLGYETTRFSTHTIDCLLTQLQTILDEMLKHPTGRLADLSLLREEEQQQLLKEWHGAQEPYNIDTTTIVQALSRQTELTPDKIALTCGDGSLTYGELERRSAQLARYLRQQGVEHEDVVGVCMERSCTLAITLLGIMKAGAVYLPLDPGSPQSRLAFMLSDAHVSLVLTRSDHLKLFATLPCKTLCLEDGQEFPTPDSTYAPLAQILPAYAAYVIYTSGSTGMPKGVVISHQALWNHVQTVSTTYNLQAEDRVLQFASLNFDVSLEELLPAWAQGASVVMWPEALAPDPARFSDFVAREGLSVLNIPSSYWHEWVGELVRPGALLPPDLRLVIIGSEKASSARFVLWQRLVGSRVALYHAYGLTETTITALAYQPAQDQAWAEARPLPIGRPLTNIQAYVLDERLLPAPPGVPGELYIGGACLARGYLRNASLTAERFLPHPYSAVPGARIYRTGDRARYLPDGTFELLGRSDTQIKLRGFRIEPAEIEERLLQHPTVREALVVAREDVPGIHTLVAYIVVNEQTTAFLERLRQHLQQSLPAYMLPAFFVPLEAMPRTSTGKIDPRLLPAPHQKLVQLDAYIAPRTPMEEILSAIWGEVLRVERVGRFDHFFKLGGHSLQATQVVARLRETLQVELPVRAIYDAPTIAALATRIEQKRQPASGLAIQALSAEERRKPLPLSFAQQRLWFLDQFQPDSAFYTLPNMLHLRGSLDVAALARSLQDLVQRHEILRTTFSAENGQPFQLIAPQMQLPLPVIHLIETEDMSRREKMVDGLARDEAQRPFDLEHGPLVRALLLRLNPQEHLLLLTLHHIIADGWSIEIMLRELSALYTSYMQGQPITLPALPVQYADYAVWQRAWLQGDFLDQQLAYWRHQLKDAPTLLELPTDRPRPAVQSYKGARYAFQLPSGLSQQLQTLSREEGVTLFMTLLTAFQTLLFRYSQQTDIVVGTPISGRIRREIEDTMGLFLNMLALRTQLNADMTYRELLASVRDVALDAYMHQDLPFEKLVEELHAERSLSHTPLFQVMFVLQNTPGHAADLPGLSLQTYGGESETAKFDLILGMRETAQGLRCNMEYCTDLFDQATIARMMAHFQTLLEGCVADPGCRLADLPLLTTSEWQQMLISWNPAQALPAMQCVHHIIEHWANKTPDALALLGDGQQITYAVLNQRANRLAHYLQELGVGPESLVGLFMTRSPDAIIGILGILKAGGAYIPLDPDSPQERLALLLKEANCAGVLTQHGLHEHLPATIVPFVLCLDCEERVSSCPDSNPINPVQPTNLAYVIYTSGSTGQPKGVMVTHESICHLAASQAPIFGDTTDIRASQWISLSFDASLSEILTTFQAGATLCLTAHDRLQPRAELLAFLQREAITNLSLPVSALALLPQATLPYLRTIAVGAEPLPGELVERWSPGRHFLNAYGPTETTVCATVAECVAGQTPTIGRPLSHVQVYILDRSLQPLPVGIPGELYIGGLGVARGYLLDPALTAELFLPNPFSTVPGTRLYRTRDLVRYRPDGSIEFLGRVDSQVKVRGYRIELGEIEAVLAQHPAVRNAAVCVHKDLHEVPHLVAYAMPAEQVYNTLSSRELRDYLQERLPDYMVPAHLLLLPELPLSSNGKIDRRALPPPTWQRDSDEDHPFVAPRTPVEQTLAAIWSEVLGVERVGIHDNFFMLGGDSIQTIQISARAQQANLYLTPRQVFQWQTVAELAEAVNLAPVAVAEQGLSTGSVALTPVQRWFFEQDLPAPHHYNQALLLESTEVLEATLLEQALASLLRHHDALRLCFSHTEEGWQQRYGSPEEVGLPHLFHANYAHLSLQEQDEAIQTVAADLHASLCLERGQLLCVGLFEAGPSRPQRLLLIIHHLVVDGVSWNILLEDLTTACRQLHSGKPVSLPPKTTSFQRWSSGLTAYASSQELRQEAPLWLAMQQKATQPLPLDFSGGAEANTEGSLERVVLTFSPEDTQALVQELPRIFRTQINDALLTALVYALQPWTGSARLLVDLEGHGREPVVEDADLSRTVGWFTTLYPVLLDLEGIQDMRQGLLAVKEQLRSIPHHGIGYGLLRYLSGTQEYTAQLRALPQAEISFNYLGQAERSQEEAGLFRPARLSTGPGFDPRGKRHYLLEIVGSISSDQLTLTWLYSKHMHERATIERLTQRYKESLQALLAQRQHSEGETYTPSDFPLARLNMKALNKISRLLEREE